MSFFVVARLPWLGFGACSLALWPWWFELIKAWGSPNLWHGPIAVLGGAWLCHRNLQKEKVEPNPIFGGLALLSSLLSMGSFWGLGRYFLAMGLYLLAIWLLIGFKFGKKGMAQTWTGLGMTVFALPLLAQQGIGILAFWVNPLALLVANGAVWLLSMTGTEVIQEGPKVLIKGGVITVGLHCAGIQYFEVFGLLVFFSWGFKGLPKYWGFYVPLVIAGVLLANISRVFIVILLAMEWGLKHLKLIDQIAGVGFMVLLLPLLLKWPIREPQPKATLVTF